MDDTIEEQQPTYFNCCLCDIAMLDAETWLRVQGEDTKEKIYCRKCVEADAELVAKSDYMCRHLVSLILNTATAEERAEMKEALKKAKPEDYKLIADLFDAPPPTIVSIVEEEAT